MNPRNVNLLPGQPAGPRPRGAPPADRPGRLRVVLVLSGQGEGGAGARVRLLADGLVARGVETVVCAPAGCAREHGLTPSGALFVPLAFGGGRGGQSRTAVLAALRRLCAGADVVHTHDLPAALAVSVAQRFPAWYPFPALPGRRGRAGAALVVTLDEPREAGAGEDADSATGRAVGRLLARRAARGADLVFGTTPEAVELARALGAADARLAPPARGPGGGRAAADVVAHVLSVYDELAEEAASPAAPAART